jgi:hypothetical protein
MDKRAGTKQSPQAIRAEVIEEMVKPKVVKSAGEFLRQSDVLVVRNPVRLIR